MHAANRQRERRMANRSICCCWCHNTHSAHKGLSGHVHRGRYWQLPPTTTANEVIMTMVVTSLTRLFSKGDRWGGGRFLSINFNYNKNRRHHQHQQRIPTGLLLVSEYYSLNYLFRKWLFCLFTKKIDDEIMIVIKWQDKFTVEAYYYYYFCYFDIIYVKREPRIFF